MKLETQDIVLQDFKKVLRGYDPVEVKAFLEVIAENYKQTVSDQLHLQRIIQDLKQSNAALAEQLRLSELEIAQLKTEVRKIDRLVDARIDADLFLGKAKEDADKLVQAAQLHVSQLRSEVDYLTAQKQRSTDVLKEYLIGQLSILNLISGEIPASADATIIAHSPNDAIPTAPPEMTDETPSAGGSTATTVEPAQNIGSYLDPSSFDELPKEIEAAIHESSDDENTGQAVPAPALSDDRRKQMVQDLDQLNEQATAMFRKADFDKMLGEAALKKSEEIINQIYSELENKKNKNQSNTEKP